MNDVKEDAAILMSIGSAMGLGIAFFISYFLGGSIYAAIVFLFFGLYGLKKNWYMIKQ